MSSQINLFYTFLVAAHAVGWCLVAHHVRSKGIIDLCQFVRMFIYAPFVLAIAMFCAGALILLIVEAVIPHILSILFGVAVIIGSCVILGLLGYFVVTPAIKKAHGIVKPFSEKICIVLYRSTK